MSMKRTDLEKNMAKKLDGRMKSAAVPARFGEASAAPPKRQADPAAAAEKMVAVSCRLPAGLLKQLRARAAGQEGGINAALAQAVERWLAAD